MGPIAIESDGEVLTGLRFADEKAWAGKMEGRKAASAIPVIAATGNLGGYAYGVEKKKRLLELEQQSKFKTQ